MAKKNQTLFGFGLQDERVPKLFGMLCLFLALYLFIAFTSYLFTWETDQDKVLRFSWGLLLESDVNIANLLGRLGAIVSNMFFYWAFGLPSYAFVFLLFIYGMGLINKVPLRRYHNTLRTSLLLMVSLSILFEFLFYSADFPWGGAFGAAVCAWLTSFLGAIGVIFLVVFVIAGLVVWNFNPDLEGMTFSKAADGTRNFFTDLWNSRYRSKGSMFSATPKNTASTKHTSLAPLRTLDMNGEPIIPDTSKTAPERKTDEAQPATNGELSLTASANKPDKPSVLKSGEAELEIAEGVKPNTSDTSDDILPTKPVQTDLFSPNHVGTDEPFDPTLELSHYEYPILQLLNSYDDQKVEIDRAELEANKDQIIETLLNYKIEITKIRATIGPTVTLYEIVPAPGVRISRIKNLEDDIALSLAALGIRIIAPIPGRGTIGIEVPNKSKQVVSMKEVLMSDKFRRTDMDLPIALGKTISNEVFVADLTKMPHLLIAGATGQGKSVGINAILMSILYKKHPSQVKLILIDPKKVELSPYSKIENHFLGYLPDQLEPIVTDTTQVIHTLSSLCIEMDQRYSLLKKAQARNIKEYNEKFIARRLNPEKGHAYMPFIVLVIDEFADLIMTAGKEIELPIGRLAQLSRAVGIHLIIATQRPSVNIITGVIKANFPVRIAFKVASKVDSRTILDTGGAEQLIGRGDMLISLGSDVIRLQCAFVDTPEVEKVIDFISHQPGYPAPFFLPEFKGENDDHSPGAVNPSELDDMFDDAARLVVQNQHGSTSMIQRRLKLGYNRAGRIMDQLEAMGVVGPNEGSKPREVLVFDEAELERYLESIRNRK